MDNLRQLARPVVPTMITVHLGKPDDTTKKNITISFIDYIKNVTCSEIYPTWHSEALKANILAIISFTLNRLYTEWYPSRGYDFDITSHYSYDQTYRENISFYDNISKLVEELFNNYIIKGNQIQPFFARYCDGKTSTCEGLLQWQTVDLANQGKNALEILRYFYGKDIYLIEDASVASNIATYPGVALKLGDVSENLRIIKRQLNRIATNYPALPKFTEIHEYFDIITENIIKNFQDIFDLPINGIIDKATWYKIKYLYTSVKKLSDIYAEGVTEEDIKLKFDAELHEGDTGQEIQALHYYLNVIAYFNPNLPSLELNSTYNKNTKKMIMAFQKEKKLEPTGILNVDTWNQIKETYQSILNNLPKEVLDYVDQIYPGRFLSLGMTGSDVKALQKMLKKANYNVTVSGCYDSNTELIIKQIQKELKLEENGVTGPLEWRHVVSISKEK